VTKKVLPVEAEAEPGHWLNVCWSKSPAVQWGPSVPPAVLECPPSGPHNHHGAEMSPHIQSREPPNKKQP